VEGALTAVGIVVVGLLVLPVVAILVVSAGKSTEEEKEK
jgi:hypothetical protein